MTSPRAKLTAGTGSEVDKALILSQDYELFFDVSGSVENCLIEPSNFLLKSASERNLKISFFVDAGMLVCMRRYSRESRYLVECLSNIETQIKEMYGAGHEIGLHVHPHWEETVWRNGKWDFSNTRFQLGEFTQSESDHIFREYANVLCDLIDAPISSYRAGGFCIEPFGNIRSAFTDTGISIDSSVVPGACLLGNKKGFDFRNAPDRSWWRFDVDPTRPVDDGDLVEVPVTPLRLPRLFYWKRALDRARKTARQDHFGDGQAKSPGKKEIARRLLGSGGMSELSIDAPKANLLMSKPVLESARPYWHVMGHPKLISQKSVDILQEFMQRKGIGGSMTVADFVSVVKG